MPHPSSIPRLAKAASGNYEIRWCENGRSKRESTGTPDLAAAKTVFAQWMFDHGKSNDVPTVSAVVASYLRERCRPDGREMFAAIHLETHLGTLPVDSLSPSEISRYMKKRSVSPGTARRELGVLVAAINYAVRQHRLRPGIAPKIDLPHGGEPRTVTLTAEESRQILVATSIQKPGERMSRLHRFIWIAMETAMRRRSIETLRWSQVDLERRVIHPHGGNRIKRRVPVPISDSLWSMLVLAKEERIGDGLMVLDHCGEVYQAWKSAMRRLAIETGNTKFNEVTPHDLRRTWATEAARAGVSLFDIAGVLGDSPAVVTKHYAHHHPDYLRAAVNFRNRPSSAAGS